MAKSIKNKQYSEFWEDDKLNVQKTEKQTEEKVSSEEIKKLEKKLTKKVSGLEKEINELKDESKKEEIQPVNKPRGWHARNEFIDDAGNVFSKGKFIGEVGIKVEKPDEEKEYVENAKKSIKGLKEKFEKSAENVIPDIPKIEVKSDERKMEMPKEVPDLSKIKPIPLRKILTDKDIYQQYIDDRIPFKMFFRGNLIFDSKIQPVRNFPKFNDDGFILFGKNYIYRGIRIEKY